MSANRAYLDWNATAPLHPAARAAVLAAMDLMGNPSSIHAEGRAARAAVETVRGQVAALVGGEAESVVFTSGASEALSSLLQGGISGCCGLDMGQDMPVLSGATEHAAVIAAAAGNKANILPVDRDGLIDLVELDRILASHGPALVAIQLANNETGVIQPICAIAARVHARSGALVVDAVQAPGRIALDIKALGADAIVLSAHKFGGPKGVGAIIFRENRIRLAKALIKGGGQERGQRGGTENVLGIIGMGAAAGAIDLGAVQRMSELRDAFEAALFKKIPDLVIHGCAAPRLPNTALVSIPGIAADRALVACDLGGIAISTGSACSSGKVKSSHVLAAMSVEAENALRISIGATTTESDLKRCEEALCRLAASRIASPASAGKAA